MRSVITEVFVIFDQGENIIVSIKIYFSNLDIGLKPVTQSQILC